MRQATSHTAVSFLAGVPRLLGTPVPDTVVDVSPGYFIEKYSFRRQPYTLWSVAPLEVVGFFEDFDEAIYTGAELSSFFSKRSGNDG